MGGGIGGVHVPPPFTTLCGAALPFLSIQHISSLTPLATHAIPLNLLPTPPHTSPHTSPHLPGSAHQAHRAHRHRGGRHFQTGFERAAGLGGGRPDGEHFSNRVRTTPKALVTRERARSDRVFEIPLLSFPPPALPPALPLPIPRCSSGTRGLAPHPPSASRRPMVLVRTSSVWTGRGR